MAWLVLKAETNPKNLMNCTQSNPSAAIRRELLTIFGVVIGLVALVSILLVIGVTGYFRLGGDTAALRRVVSETTGQQWRRKVEFNIGSWTTSLARLGVGFVPMDSRVREVLGGVRSAEAGVYRLAESLDPGKIAKYMAATDQAMDGRGWDRVVGVRHHDDTVMVYVPRRSISPDDLSVCFVVVHGRDVVVGRGRSSLEPLMSLWRAEQSRPDGLTRFLARSR